MVGTRKGSFIISSDPTRKNWQVSGPHNPGCDIFHMAYDHRNGGTVFSAANHMVWGPQIEYSHDLGNTWQSSKEQPRFSDQKGAKRSKGCGTLSRAGTRNRASCTLELNQWRYSNQKTVE
jgi:hypothetical protein